MPSVFSSRRLALQRSILLLGAALCVGTLAQAQTREVVIGYQDMVVPWRFAQETKELEKRTGYKVTYRKLGSGAEVTRALASGAIQIGEAGSSPFAAALSQGVPIQVFWILDDIHEAEALVARNGAGVNSLADLKGKKIGVPYVSTTHFHTLVALEDAGINPKDVKTLNLRPPEILAAWERGDVDATFVWDPVLAKAKQNGKVITTSGQIAAKTGKAVADIEKLTVWGNHSPTMYADYRFATINGESVAKMINDQEWNANVFLPTVGKRGAAIIEARGLSSAASAANAAIDHMRDWALGTNGKWVTMGIPSDGQYGIPKDTMFGFPVTCENGEYKVVEGLEIDAFSQACIDKTLAELQGEQDGVKHLL